MEVILKDLYRVCKNQIQYGVQEYPYWNNLFNMWYNLFFCFTKLYLLILLLKTYLKLIQI